MTKRKARIIAILFGGILFAVIFPYSHDMYIGWLHTVICILLNGASCVLFAAMLGRKLAGGSLREDFGIYLWFLILLGAGHCVFAFMNWGSWLCIALSVPALILLITDKQKHTD